MKHKLILTLLNEREEFIKDSYLLYEEGLIFECTHLNETTVTPLKNIKK